MRTPFRISVSIFLVLSCFLWMHLYIEYFETSAELGRAKGQISFLSKKLDQALAKAAELEAKKEEVKSHVENDSIMIEKMPSHQDPINAKVESKTEVHNDVEPDSLNSQLKELILEKTKLESELEKCKTAKENNEKQQKILAKRLIEAKRKKSRGKLEPFKGEKNYSSFSGADPIALFKENEDLKLELETARKAEKKSTGELKESSNTLNLEHKKEPGELNESSNTLKLDLKEKPLYAIFHPGPSKMGTSTIQEALIRDVKLLWKDNYRLIPVKQGVMLGRCLKEPNCEETDVWRKFLTFLNRARIRKKNIVISSEHMGALASTEHARSLLQSALRPWKVRLVLGYRRFFETIPSDYFQIHRCDTWPRFRKWPDEGGESQSFFRYFFSGYGRGNQTALPEFGRGSHKTNQQWDRWAPYFPDDVKIINLHEGDLVKRFYCDMLIEAPNTCSNVSVPKKSNSGWTLLYDQLALAAYAAGLVKKELSRAQVALLAQVRQESHLKLSPFDFPLKCMTDAQKEVLLNASLSYEHEIVPGWYEVDKTRHEADFKVAAQSKLCDIDTESVLKDESWRTYFSEMEFNESMIDKNLGGFYPKSFKMCNKNA